MSINIVVPDPAYAPVRRWPRYKLNVPVRLIVERDGKVIIVSGRGTELNEGGLCVFAGVELALDQRISVEFTPPYNGLPIRARAAVRNRNGYSYGLEFVVSSRLDFTAVETIRAALVGMSV